MKFPPLLMVFAVISLGYKSDLVVVDGSIYNDQYIRNLEHIGLSTNFTRDMGIWAGSSKRMGHCPHVKP
jgi:hypothetical protein